MVRCCHPVFTTVTSQPITQNVIRSNRDHCPSEWVLIQYSYINWETPAVSEDLGVTSPIYCVGLRTDYIFAVFYSTSINYRGKIIMGIYSMVPQSNRRNRICSCARYIVAISLSCNCSQRYIIPLYALFIWIFFWFRRQEVFIVWRRISQMSWWLKNILHF